MSCEPNRTSAYSSDLRWRIVWLRITRYYSYRAISRSLCVGIGTVSRVLQQFNDTGEVRPNRRKERRHLRTLDDLHELFIIGVVLEHPAIEQTEMCSMIESATNVKVSISTVCRLLKKYGITRKKIRTVASQRSATLRGRYMSEVLFFKRDMFVWLDETGCDRRNFMRRYGYALRGERAVERRFLARGIRTNAIAAISSVGVVAYQLLQCSIDAQVFFDFIRADLLPNLQPFDGENSSLIVIMDNLSVHHVDEVVELLRASGILVIFLPPYSPDLNPIEEAFSYVKYYLREHEDIFNTLGDPIPFIHAAFNSITAEHCNSWITDSGYN